MSDVLYSLADITKQYDQRSVLRIDELTIRRGEILALVGPSGAGKSTLLRLLNFLEPPSTGTVRFEAHDFSAQSTPPLAIRRRVTTVFQKPVLLRGSVYENVAYGLKLRGRRNEADRIMAALEQVGLVDLARQPARTLSGGEAQRVALARAIILEPTALLLDEPTANLDPYNVGLIESIATDLNRSRGTTLVLVTHNTFQAKRMARRVALLLEGAIVELGDATPFFESPTDPRTAAFISGRMVY